MPSSHEDIRIGSVIGERYRLESILGQGGMGVVYSGVHELTHRRVALKLLHRGERGDPAALSQRFLVEARTAASVKHPNVVDVLDMGMHDGSPFLVMELLEGTTLDAAIAQRGRIEVQEALEWLLPIMGALARLHERGIVHRDLKPSNILLSTDEHGQVVPKLLDFGLARVTGDLRLTRSGIIIGTPIYLAPERAAGAEVGLQSDIWSMGVVWFECLAGVPPFNEGDHGALIAQIMGGRTLQLRSLVQVPEEIEAAVHGALQLSLSRRYPTMEAFASGLVRAAAEVDLLPSRNPESLGFPNNTAWLSAARQKPSASFPGVGREDLTLSNELGPARRAPGWKLAGLLTLGLTAGLLYWWMHDGDAQLAEPTTDEPIEAPRPITESVASGSGAQPGAAEAPPSEASEGERAPGQTAETQAEDDEAAAAPAEDEQAPPAARKRPPRARKRPARRPKTSEPPTETQQAPSPEPRPISSSPNVVTEWK